MLFKFCQFCFIVDKRGLILAPPMFAGPIPIRLPPSTSLAALLLERPFLPLNTAGIDCNTTLDVKFMSIVRHNNDITLHPLCCQAGARHNRSTSHTLCCRPDHHNIRILQFISVCAVGVDAVVFSLRLQLLNFKSAPSTGGTQKRC